MDSQTLALGVRETAKRLNCSVDAVYDGIKRDQIPAIRLGKKILIPVAALERLLAGAGSGRAVNG